MNSFEKNITPNMSQCHQLVDSLPQNNDHFVDCSENYAIQNEDDLSANKMDKSQHSDQRTKTISDIDTIPFIHSNKNDQQNNEQQQIGVPTVSVVGMLSLWLDKRQLLLIPFTLYSGISQAFEYGNFPAITLPKSNC